MHYIILIYGDEKNFAMMSDDPKAKADMYAAFMRYGADMQAVPGLRPGARPDARRGRRLGGAGGDGCPLAGRRAVRQKFPVAMSIRT